MIPGNKNAILECLEYFLHFARDEGEFLIVVQLKKKEGYKPRVADRRSDLRAIFEYIEKIDVGVATSFDEHPAKVTSVNIDPIKRIFKIHAEVI